MKIGVQIPHKLRKEVIDAIAKARSTLSKPTGNSVDEAPAMPVVVSTSNETNREKVSFSMDPKDAEWFAACVA